MNESLNPNHNTQRPRKKKVSITFIITVVFLSLITLSSLFFAYYCLKLYKDEVNKELSEKQTPTVTYTEEEVDIMLAEARKEAYDSAVGEYREELKYTAENNNGIIKMLRKLYPEYFVFFNKDHYEFVEILDTIPPANFENENIIANDGFLEYKVDGEVLSKKGIDVSKFQGDIDWQKVADSGVDYVMIRTGLRGYETGKLVTDENFIVNVEGATDAGLDVGVYFFTQATNDAEAREEAEYVLELIKDYNITYPIAIDIEDLYNDNARSANQSKESRTDCAITFMETIKAAGYTPAIYGNLNTFTKLVDVNRLGEYKKWFALYDTEIYFPYEIDIWQYSDKGQIDGITGDVDLNITFPVEK